MDIYDNIRARKYENSLPYPSAKDFKIGKTATEAEIAERNKQRAAYRNEENRLYTQFKKDLLEHLGFTNHPKAEKLFAMAWSDGHASGYEEVAICADRYAELLRD
jgi:hypothetical protein